MISRIGEIYLHGSRKKKKIALTFDDGPCEKTKKILDILKKENAKATFFVIGNKVERNKNTILRAIKQGCEIGNHSYSHKRLLSRRIKTIFWEIKHTDEELEKIGVKTKLFRFPYFKFGLRGIIVCWWLRKKVIFSDFMPNDYKLLGPKNSVEYINKKTMNGSIIVLHDYIEGIGKNGEIVKIVTGVVRRLKNKGYEFVTVSELLGFEN